MEDPEFYLLVCRDMQLVELSYVIDQKPERMMVFCHPDLQQLCYTASDKGQDAFPYSQELENFVSAQLTLGHSL